MARGMKAARWDSVRGEWRCYGCGDIVAKASFTRPEVIDGIMQNVPSDIPRAALRAEYRQLPSRDGLLVYGLSRRTLVRQKEPHHHPDRDGGYVGFVDLPVVVYCVRPGRCGAKQRVDVPTGRGVIVDGDY
jgi:hypothetical protein